MSRFFSKKFASLTPYVPGEQPRDRRYIKLNTNESPFPPSPLAQKYAAQEAGMLELYSDPWCTALTDKAAQLLGIAKDQIIFTNGSDDALNFAFMAFCDAETPAIFPDITYGFYKVFAELGSIPYQQIPLKEDFTIDINDYCKTPGTVFIANPNAPTGLCLSLSDIETIVKSDPNRVVVIDEAYIDFGGESAVSLIDQYENLLVIQTFSKSRSMAGGRLGMGIGCKALIQDLNAIKYSTNPYNINRLTLLLGAATVDAEPYYREKCREIMETRSWTARQLEDLGFRVLPSNTNFLFVKTEKMDGGELYEALKARGILVRHFGNPKICQYNRITIGTKQQMEALIHTLKEVLL